MTKILNHINTYADLTAYNNDKEKDFPNISYIQGTDEVKWVKEDPYIIVCKYNVTSTKSATKLLNSNSGITYQIIDGVRQSSVKTTYTFHTLGEHIVKYKLNGTSIGNSAFQNCSGLTSITIPSNVTSIGSSAFWNCKGLTSVTIGNGVTSISSLAFYGCTGLASISIPDSVTSIDEGAFSGCSRLTSITIGSGVTSIGGGAFYGCNSLPIENNIRYADTYVVEVVDKTLATYTIKEGTKWIGDNAFDGCTGLTNVTIPDSVISIGTTAFSSCSGLTSITIPDSVTSIGDNAFDGCEGLTSITIPDSVTSIGEFAFYECSGLTNVTIEATTPPTLGFNAFDDTNNYPVYVPSESVETYKAASDWSSLASRIKPITE